MLRNRKQVFKFDNVTRSHIGNLERTKGVLNVLFFILNRTDQFAALELGGSGQNGRPVDVGVVPLGKSGLSAFMVFILGRNVIINEVCFIEGGSFGDVSVGNGLLGNVEKGHRSGQSIRLDESLGAGNEIIQQHK